MRGKKEKPKEGGKNVDKPTNAEWTVCKDVDAETCKNETSK